jgi:DNA recombination protein RmuC
MTWLQHWPIEAQWGLVVAAILAAVLPWLLYLHRSRQLAELRTALTMHEQAVTHWQAKAQQTGEDLAAELARREAEQQAHQQQLAFIDKSREDLKNSYRQLAQELFEQRSRQFAENNQQSMSALLDPVREQLKDFRQLVTDSYQKESKERHMLLGEITRLKELNQQISDDAVHLTRALRGESKTQGNWGEMILERLLEASGLQRERQYRVEVSGQNEEGRRLRPDVVVYLPENRQIVIDSKVSLTAYEQYCRQEDVEQARRHLDAHVQSVRGHVRSLSEKRYTEIEDVHSLDFVIMFVPVEAAFLDALRHDDGLYDEALSRNVVMVSASTLLATLRTIANLWRFDDQNRNAQEIAKRGGQLYDKFVLLGEELEEVSRLLERSQDKLRSSIRRTTSGPGNLARQVEQLRELGVEARKRMSERWLENEE